MNDLYNMSATDLGRLVNAQDISASELTKYFIDRISKYNKDINAFVYTKFDEALKSASHIDEKIAKGEYLGPFAGVPFALKDFLPSKKGWTHSYGGIKSLICEDKYSSVFCEAMEKAGAIAVGKTNSPSFGFRGLCDNKLYGPTRNPFNLNLNSGGSSGGSAAAVAAGLVPIAEGGDAGGSIRIPAAWCNLFGYKASVGTIPSVCRPDAWSATHPFCFNGGLTKTVIDAATLLNYMAYYNPRDPFSLKTEINYLESMKQSIKGFKIAFTYDFDMFEVDPEIKSIVEKAVKEFENLGAVVDIVKFNFPRSADDYAKIWCKSICIDTAIDLELKKKSGFDIINKCRNEFPEEFIYWNDIVSRSGLMDYYDINLARTEILDAQQDIFDKYDLIISPTVNCMPVLNKFDGNTLGPETHEPLIGFTQTFLFNFTGNPAASIPAGMSENNLPVGMQIVGKRFNDLAVLQASYNFELIKPWHKNYSLIKL